MLVSIPVCLLFLSIWPILNLKQFNHYFYIPSFKMPTVRHAWQLIQHGNYAFSIDLQDASLHIPIVILCHFFICLAQYTISVEGFIFWAGPAPRVFAALTKPILFLCHHKGFHIVICLDDVLVLVHCKQPGKRAHSFLCSLLVLLASHIKFSQSDLHLNQIFLFLGVIWGYCPYVSVFAS